MSGTLKTLFPRLLFWLAAEIVLNLVGLDNLADYSEFITGQSGEYAHSNAFISSIYSRD
ncbi:MAG: hypothetical protein AAFQ40_01530 [Cyanobacteria bacterium J06623_5]